MLPKIYDKIYDETAMIPTQFEIIMNDFFDSFFEPGIIRSDVFSGDDETLCVDVPGFNKDNLQVSTFDGIITIKGENDNGRKIEKKIKLTRHYGDPVEAEIKDGVLKLKFDILKNGKKQIELK